jgi:uncharacterized membrane protein required for colicin V production
MLHIDTSAILKILATASGIMVAIQGLKNLFPAIFAKVPNLGMWIAAVAALIASLSGCLSSGVDIGCVIQAVLTFLAAVGIYHSVAQAGGAVNPPLPPAPKA